MKKTLFLLVTGMMLSLPAFAGDKGTHLENCTSKMERTGGFTGVVMKPVSLAEVQKMPEYAKVAVEGYLTEQVDDDEYMFTDGDSYILVKIGEKKWRGQIVTPKDKVYLRGKIERKHDQSIIDVKAIQLLK